MPFGSYEESKEQAFKNAARVLKETGCGAIKVEGGKRMRQRHEVSIVHCHRTLALGCVSSSDR